MKLYFIDLELAMLSGSLITTAWRILRLQMEEMASRYGRWLRIY
jgi:hypothetical protein